MELNIDPGKFIYRVLLHGLLVTPESVSGNELTELCAVVAKVIEPDYVITES